MSAAQLDTVADDLFQLVLLGIACKEGHFHAGFGGAGVARFHRELYGLRAEAGDDGGVFDGVAVAEDDGVAQLAPHHAGEVVGVRTPQGGGAVGDLSGKIAVRHSGSYPELARSKTFRIRKFCSAYTNCIRLPGAPRTGELARNA